MRRPSQGIGSAPPASDTGTGKETVKGVCWVCGWVGALVFFFEKDDINVAVYAHTPNHTSNSTPARVGKEKEEHPPRYPRDAKDVRAPRTHISVLQEVLLKVRGGRSLQVVYPAT